jgi:hypothetical protein
MDGNRGLFFVPLKWIHPVRHILTQAGRLLYANLSTEIALHGNLMIVCSGHSSSAIGRLAMAVGDLWVHQDLTASELYVIMLSYVTFETANKKVTSSRHRKQSAL